MWSRSPARGGHPGGRGRATPSPGLRPGEGSAADAVGVIRLPKSSDTLFDPGDGGPADVLAGGQLAGRHRVRGEPGKVRNAH